MVKVKFSFYLAALLGLVLVPVITAESDIPNDESLIQSTLQRIAFVSRRDGNSEIYSINEDGTGLKRLTNSKNNNVKPQWSPDGSKVMYLTKKGKKHEIRVMNSDGSNQIKLAGDCNIQYPPSWSPDGSKILFVVKVKSKNIIYTVSTNGNNLTRITEIGTDNAYPSWSPDGTKILFRQRYRKETYLYTTNRDGTDKVKLTRENESYYFPIWSSDGQKIYFVMTKRSFKGVFNEIYMVNNDGTNILKIADGTKKVQDIDYYDELFLSPDNSTITYNKVAHVDGYMSEKGSIRYNYTHGIFILSAFGNDWARELARTGGDRVQIDWSPDSSKLAFIHDSRVTIYNIKTKIDEEIKVKASVPLSPVKWSPDGKKLIFAGKNHSFQKAGLFLVTLDGKVTKLTENNDYDPVWAPVKEMGDEGSEM